MRKRFHEEDVVCPCHPSVVPKQDGVGYQMTPPGYACVGAVVKNACIGQEQLTLTSTNLLKLLKEVTKVPILSFDPYLSLHLQSRWGDSRVEGTSPKVPGNLFIRSRSCFLIVYLARRISSGRANKGGVVPVVNTILRSRREKQYHGEETQFQQSEDSPLLDADHHRGR